MMLMKLLHRPKFPLKPIRPLGWWIAGALLGLSLHPSPAPAAEKIVLKYGILQEDFAVKDIARFAKTGKASSHLDLLLKLSQRDPVQVRNSLNQPIKINHRLLDLALNTDPGEIILDQVSEVIRTPAGQADRQALRSALVLAASDDGKLTLLEVIQKYPTAEVRVEGDRLVPAYQQLVKLEQKAQQLKDLLTLW
jgi:hypothetical protein